MSTSQFTAALAFKAAFFNRMGLIVPATAGMEYVQVVPGTPATYGAEDIVMVGRVSTDQGIAQLGTNRSREETLELEVIVSCYRGGGEDQEIAVQQRAFDILAVIEKDVRRTDTTLGGVVRQCFLTHAETEGATPPELVDQGRFADVVATFTAQNRVTG